MIKWEAMSDDELVKMASKGDIWEHMMIDRQQACEITDELNQLGSLGWELVSVQTVDTHAVSGNPYTSRYFFKRHIR